MKFKIMLKIVPYISIIFQNIKKILCSFDTKRLKKNFMKMFSLVFFQVSINLKNTWIRIRLLHKN